jgi:hypothetical protein
MLVFLNTKCRWCKYYKYLNSDYGRLGTDYYTCSKDIYASTRENKWYLKAQKCKYFETPYLLSEEDLEEIKEFENETIE